MNQDKVNEIAKELELFTEYRTIRVKDKAVVDVKNKVDALHERIIRVAYERGYKDGLIKAEAQEKNGG